MPAGGQLQSSPEKESIIATLNKLIALGEVTQICKTSICLLFTFEKMDCQEQERLFFGTWEMYLDFLIFTSHHLAANLLIDENFRKYTPEVLYIGRLRFFQQVTWLDCEGGFDISIYQKIIGTLLKNQSKTNKKDEFLGGKFEEIKSKFFDRLHYKRVLSHLELFELLQKLPELLKQRALIKLIIFDTFTTHMRSITDQKNINKTLNEYTNRLLGIAQKLNISVNQKRRLYLIHFR